MLNYPSRSTPCSNALSNPLPFRDACSSFVLYLQLQSSQPATYSSPPSVTLTSDIFNLRKRTDATRGIHRGLTVRILAPSALISAAVDILSTRILRQRTRVQTKLSKGTCTRHRKNVGTTKITWQTFAVFLGAISAGDKTRSLKGLGITPYLLSSNSIALPLTSLFNPPPTVRSQLYYAGANSAHPTSSRECAKGDDEWLDPVL
ncbi:hypothetical protein BJ165DRAFT_1503712, partial [Panaeolus papilionaceus]